MTGEAGHSAATAPLDQEIEVRTIEEDILVRVKRNRSFRRYLVIEGDGSSVWPAAVDVWRDAPHHSIGIGTPLDELLR